MKLGLFIGRFALDWLGFPYQTHAFFNAANTRSWKRITLRREWLEEPL